MATPSIFRLGTTTIAKIHETDLDAFALTQLLPGLDMAVARRHSDWIPPGTTAGADLALMSVHSWLVRHAGLTILVDTGIGNDKPRPQQLALDRLHTPFLDRLADAGVQPEEVDLILLTHIHSDHVGWNTRLADGTWEPTFPNAEVICSDLEFRYGAALTDGDEAGIAACRAEAGLGSPVRIPVSGTFADSMRPLEGRVRLRRVAIDGSEIAPGVRFVSTPGHSIDHASIELTCEDEVALFSGDVFHHPVEIAAADLVSVFCEFPEPTRRSRQRFMELAAASKATVFSSHFPLSSVGRIEPAETGYSWTACW